MCRGQEFLGCFINPSKHSYVLNIRPTSSRSSEEKEPHPRTKPDLVSLRNILFSLNSTLNFLSPQTFPVFPPPLRSVTYLLLVSAQVSRHLWHQLRISYSVDFLLELRVRLLLTLVLFPQVRVPVRHFMILRTGSFLYRHS